MNDFLSHACCAAAAAEICWIICCRKLYEKQKKYSNFSLHNVPSHLRKQNYYAWMRLELFYTLLHASYLFSKIDT